MLGLKESRYTPGDEQSEGQRATADLVRQK